jgi:hypothetical protein
VGWVDELDDVPDADVVKIMSTNMYGLLASRRPRIRLLDRDLVRQPPSCPLQATLPPGQARACVMSRKIGQRRTR